MIATTRRRLGPVRPFARAAAVGLALALAGCASAPQKQAEGEIEQEIESAVAEATKTTAKRRSSAHYQVVGFADLPGWREDEMAKALPAFRRSCAVIARRKGAHSLGDFAGDPSDWSEVCGAA